MNFWLFYILIGKDYRYMIFGNVFSIWFNFFIAVLIYLLTFWYFGKENCEEGTLLSEKKGNLTSGRSANGTNDAIINCTKDWPLRPFHTRNLKEASPAACATRNLLTRSNYTTA